MAAPVEERFGEPRNRLIKMKRAEFGLKAKNYFERQMYVKTETKDRRR